MLLQLTSSRCRLVRRQVVGLTVAFLGLAGGVTRAEARRCLLPEVFQQAPFRIALASAFHNAHYVDEAHLGQAVDRMWPDLPAEVALQRGAVEDPVLLQSVAFDSCENDYVRLCRMGMRRLGSMRSPASPEGAFMLSSFLQACPSFSRSAHNALELGLWAETPVVVLSFGGKSNAPMRATVSVPVRTRWRTVVKSVQVVRPRESEVVTSRPLRVSLKAPTDLVPEQTVEVQVEVTVTRPPSGKILAGDLELRSSRGAMQVPIAVVIDTPLDGEVGKTCSRTCQDHQTMCVGALCAMTASTCPCMAAVNGDR